MLECIWCTNLIGLNSTVDTSTGRGIPIPKQKLAREICEVFDSVRQIQEIQVWVRAIENYCGIPIFSQICATTSNLL